MSRTHILYIGMGSNLGDGSQQLDTALQQLRTAVGEVLAVSDYVSSEPWGFDSPHRFTNAVCVVRTALSPLEALDVTQAIERQMGRTHKHLPGQPYQDRVIDLDLLRYDDLVWHDERLTLPHPLIDERPFVWQPMQQCEARLKAACR